MSRGSRDENIETLVLLALGCLMFLAGGFVTYLMLVIL